MQVIEHQQLTPSKNVRSVVAIGKFDGVHLGHVQILKRVVERARALHAIPVAYTFEPHPLKVLIPHLITPMISTFDERLSRIEAAGIALTVWARFTPEYASQDPKDFIRSILRDCLGAVEIWVGPDFAFGRGRNGTIDLLRQEGEKWGFSVHVMPPISIAGDVVSSTRVRQAVVAADFRCAERLLGRPYGIWGKVAPTAGGRGSPGGYMLLAQQELLPPPGLYSAWAISGSNILRPVVATISQPFSGEGKNEITFSVERFRDVVFAETEVRFVHRLGPIVTMETSAASSTSGPRRSIRVERQAGALPPDLQSGVYPPEAPLFLEDAHKIAGNYIEI